MSFILSLCHMLINLLISLSWSKWWWTFKSWIKTPVRLWSPGGSSLILILITIAYTLLRLALKLNLRWAVVVVYAFNPSVPEAEAGGSLVWDQSGLQSEFQNCVDREKPCLEKSHHTVVTSPLPPPLEHLQVQNIKSHVPQNEMILNR